MNTCAAIAYFEGQIDATQFGVVRNYLTSSRSPIGYVLHVKEPDMLARLAAQLDRALGSRSAPQARLHEAIDPLIAEGSLRISSREPQSSALPGVIVDPVSIPRSAPCHVIYLPPFYLVHTQGLFEGKFQADKSRGQSVEPPKTHEESQAQEPARKQTKDYGMSH